MDESVEQISDRLIQEGLSFHKAGRIDKAAELYRQAMEVCGKNINAKYLLGIVHMDSGHPDHAIRFFDEVIRQWPHSEKAMQAMSICYDMLGRKGISQSFSDRHDEIVARHEARSCIVFGDSHSDYCFSGIPDCVHHLIGYYTMHRIGRDGIGVIDISRYGVRPTDTVIFIFGEIDVRMHIGRQRDERGRDVQEIIEDLTVRYFRTISENAALVEGVRMVVSSVVPPSERHPREVQPKYGTLSDRVLFSRLLNRRIEALSREHGFGYLDVFTPFAREDGTMNPVFSDDTVHVNKEFHRIVEVCLRSTIQGMGWSAPRE